MNILSAFKLAADCKADQSFIPSLWTGLQDATTCEVTVDSLADITQILINAVQIVLAVAGFAAVGFIIWGGIQYMMSAGDPGRVKKAKDTIVNAVVGLVIVLVSFGAVKLVTGAFK
jgi:hypothetical protein